MIRKKWISAVFFISLGFSSATATAQTIRVSPEGVNVSSQDATSVFLTFASLRNYRAAEACFCGDIEPAAPGLGSRCSQATLFGCLPARYDRSTVSGDSAYTDVLSVPPSVARRAYEDAVDGADSRFFYVRHFVSTNGGPDQFVPVTLRLSGGGARTPLSLTDVKLSFKGEPIVLMVKPSDKMPELNAALTYTGTGQLKGRWEVVLPGEQTPDTHDLLTEAALPVEQRGQQRRYTELSRFNVFLPPIGHYVLPGPDPSRMPSTVEGPYLILLRIEASDEREADSDLASIGAGPGVVHSGAVAGFPSPLLHYYVGSGNEEGASAALSLLSPAANAVLPDDKVIDFTWNEMAAAALYRLEVEGADGKLILSALLPPGSPSYRAPSWLRDKAGGNVRWYIIAINNTGVEIGRTAAREFRIK